jgi:hypothetical protein
MRRVKLQTYLTSTGWKNFLIRVLVINRLVAQLAQNLEDIQESGIVEIQFLNCARPELADRELGGTGNSIIFCKLQLFA